MVAVVRVAHRDVVGNRPSLVAPVACKDCPLTIGRWAGMRLHQIAVERRMGLRQTANRLLSIHGNCSDFPIGGTEREPVVRPTPGISWSGFVTSTILQPNLASVPATR